ncbi:unnamed protein product [Calypogeia fissa]
MEGGPGVAEKLYRLRLVLPDLSQSFVGNWLASVDKSIPPELLLDFDDLFDAAEKQRSGDVKVSKRSIIEASAKNKTSARENVYSNDTIRENAKSATSHELWLRAGELAPRGPEVHTWEVCHGLENWLLDKASQRSSEASLPLPHARNSLLVPDIEDGELNALQLSSKLSPRSQPIIVPESDLVRDSLYALQGLPSAVRKLERLARVYCTCSADKSAQYLSTLWTRSVTASALGKVLSVVARAGHVRCQLDAFVRFFLDDRVDPCEEMTDDAPKLSRKANKKKKSAGKVAEKLERSGIDPAHFPKSSDKKVPRHCLVNQAFAAAVKGILRGHSAALNTLASSVSLRRDLDIGGTCRGKDLGEQDPGPVIGYGNRDISLLEFYLHTRELRVQLHALAFICLKREGKSFVGRTPSDACLEEDFVDPKDHEEELGPQKARKSNAKGDVKCDPLVDSFEEFPRGADLLTYLYDRLMEVDPLHMELLRFLFERAYEPYSIFVQSWIYQAAVKDPYGEFIIDQADFNVVSSSSKSKAKLVADPHTGDLKLRSGLYVPKFMESICTPLIRAGEQLQVLLKLAETCELAQQMANNTRNPETLWPQNSTESLLESSEDAPYMPALVFSKKKVAENAKHKETNSQDMRSLWDTGNKYGPRSSEMEETEKAITTCVTADARNSSMDPRDPIEVCFNTDPEGVSKGVKSIERSPEVQSLISGYQRGTSWQLWGLPVNPFLGQADKEDSEPNTYVYPSFTGTYQHWDVTAKPTFASITSKHYSSLDKSKRSSKYVTDINVEPSWFPRLESVLNEQIFAGLDAQLKLPSWSQADLGYVGDEAGQWGLTEFYDQLQVELDPRPTRPPGFQPQDNSVLDSLPSPPLNSSLTLASNNSFIDEPKVDLSSERVSLQSLQSNDFQGPAKHNGHLRSSDTFSPDGVQGTSDDYFHEDDLCPDEIPLSVVVSNCIAEEILSQYQSVSTMTVRLFQEGLCLQDHYTALRRYYFMERGDWAEYFTTALCQHRWGPLGGELRQMEVQGMLQGAFQKSSCEGDAYAERVYVTLQESRYHCENSILASTKKPTSYVDTSRLDAFDFIALEYRVDWPLSLILTKQSFGLYNVVFTFLMRMKLTVHALGDIWQRLQLIDRSLHKDRVSSSSQQQRNRFRTLQQFRQQIYHFVTTLQRYVESKLLNVVWSKFLQDIQLEVNDMQDLEIVHCAYLKEAIEGCFLSTKTRGVKGCIESVMQCVLDFSAHMRNAYWNREKVDLIDDTLFMQVHHVKKGFQVSLQQLHGYHMKQEPQGRTNLDDLWTILDYNGFLTTALSGTHS